VWIDQLSCSLDNDLVLAIGNTFLLFAELRLVDCFISFFDIFANSWRKFLCGTFEEVFSACWKRVYWLAFALSYFWFRFRICLWIIHFLFCWNFTRGKHCRGSNILFWQWIVALSLINSFILIINVSIFIFKALLGFFLLVWFTFSLFFV
jgi:hypothetical protein